MQSHRILVVDDDPTVLHALGASLKPEYNVFSATNAQDALAIMDDENIALTISDHKMEGMTGVELMEKLSRKHPDVVRILVTGYAEDELFMDAINVGHIYGFINKPWRVAELRNMVRKGIRHYDKTQVLREPHIRTLLHSGILSVEQLDSVIQANEESEKSIGEILVEQGYADEDTILTCYATQLGIPYIPLTQFPKEKRLARMLSSELAREHTIVLVDQVAQTLVMAASEPLNENTKRDIEEVTGKRVVVTLAKRQDIEARLKEYYGDEPLQPERQHENAASQQKGVTADAQGA